MNKQEILARGRSENITEYEEKILNDSHNLSRFVIAGILVVFFLINVIYSDLKALEKGLASFDYAAILMGLISYQYFYKYIKLKEKNDRLLGITFGALCIVFGYLYVINL